MYQDIEKEKLLEERVQDLEDIVGVLLTEIEELREPNIKRGPGSFRDPGEFQRIDPNSKDVEVAQNG